ncbi:MAG: MFS transporter [Thermomicrobiales bacterium]|nr:MFS transporter [Thermomicrobiales bacterium]
MRKVGNARPLWWLLVSNFISSSGNIFSNLAIPWFVLATTGSAARMGVVVAAGTIPTILVGIFGGALIDRFGYRATSIVSDMASAISVLSIPLLHATIGLEFWQLIVLVVLGAALDAPGRTARRALYPELIELSGIASDRANALYMTSSRTADLLAPPVAGVMIAAIGAANLLYVDAVSFVISAAIMVAAIPTIPLAGPVSKFANMREYLVEVKDGFRFLRSREVLFWMLVSFSVGTLVAEPIYSAILPVYSREILKSSVALGFIFSALGIGSLLGNVLYAWIGEKVSRSAVLLGGFTVRALAFSVMILKPDWWVVALAIFMGAVAFEPINPVYMSVQQEEVPAGMRARVFGASSAMMMCPAPIGILMFGFLMEGLGIEKTLYVFVALNLLVPIGMAMVPSLRSIKRPETLESARA